MVANKAAGKGKGGLAALYMCHIGEQGDIYILRKFSVKLAFL